MAKIKESVVVQAPSATLWDIISDLDNEPAYWKGTKSVRNISRTGDAIQREITIAFQNKKCTQTVQLHPPNSIRFEFTGGIIKGSKTITITKHDDAATLTATWDIRLGGMMGMFSSVVAGHIREGTMKALESIKKEAEGRTP